MTTDFPTAPSAYGLNGPSAAVTVEKSPLASHTEILTPPWQVPQASPGLMPNPAQGKSLFLQNCASCHGTDLKGVDKGDMKGPPLLHKIYEPSHHGDAAFQLAAKNGVRAHHWPYGDMPPVPKVTPDDVAHITAYVRAEQRKIGIH